MPWTPGAALPDPSGPGYPPPAGMPTVPGVAVRPSSWPRGSEPNGPVGPQPPGAAIRPLGNARPCEGAQVLARVPNNNVILSSDVLLGLDEFLSRNRDSKASAVDIEKQRVAVVREVTAGLDQIVAHLADPDPGSYVDPQRRVLIQQILHQQIERKLVFQDFLRTVPKEALPNVGQLVPSRVRADRIARKLLKAREGPIAQDLEWALRSHGSSLKHEQRMFLEEVIYGQWIRDKVKVDKNKEVTHGPDCSLGTRPMRRISTGRPEPSGKNSWSCSRSTPAARKPRTCWPRWETRCWPGRRWRTWPARISDGVTAAQGGLRDWTSQGSLASEELDRAV